MDWGLGRYEEVAAQLRPAAEELVALADPRPGERVVDLGCGDGNAALIAAERGARVTGIDPAPRLLEVAAARAGEARLEATFLAGGAASMPLEDGAADLLISVFGVIFAPDPEAAVAEIDRVTAADGRIVVSAWIPEGAISQTARIGREAVAAALRMPPGPPPFAWHRLNALEGLLGPRGFALSSEERTISFTGESPREWVERELRSHPLQVAAAAVLGPRGEAEAVTERVLAVLEAENEDPAAFRITSRYVIVTARRR